MHSVQQKINCMETIVSIAQFQMHLNVDRIKNRLFRVFYLARIVKMPIQKAKIRLAENLQILRAIRGFSQVQLAKRVGVNPSQISLWENAKSATFVGAENLTKLAHALQVDISVLFQEKAAEPGTLSRMIKPSRAEVRAEAEKLLKRFLASLAKKAIEVIEADEAETSLE